MASKKKVMINVKPYVVFFIKKMITGGVYYPRVKAMIEFRNEDCDVLFSAITTHYASFSHRNDNHLRNDFTDVWFRLKERALHLGLTTANRNIQLHKDEEVRKLIEEYMTLLLIE